MSKRNRKPAQGPAGGRGRSVPVQVGKPFPWGTVLVSVVLAALLIGLVAYAFVNQGSGVRDLLAEDDASFAGITTLEDPARDHVPGRVEYPDYPERPPAGGEHSGVPQQCDVYEEEIPPEQAVHSLEHGAVWVTYQPDLDDDQVETLRDLVEGDPYRLMSPLPGQSSPIVLTAWGRQLEADDADDREVRRFLNTYTNGRQTPEKGAACSGAATTGRDPEGAGALPEGLPEPGSEDAGSGDQAPADQEPAPEPTG